MNIRGFAKTKEIAIAVKKINNRLRSAALHDGRIRGIGRSDEAKYLFPIYVFTTIRCQ